MEALAINTLLDCKPPNSASVPKPSSVAKNSDQSTEPVFGRPQKPGSAKSLSNHFEPRETNVSNPNHEYAGRSRLQWARDIWYYRRKLDDGVARPFWPFRAGPRPTERGCFAPRDLLQRFGFGGAETKSGQ